MPESGPYGLWFALEGMHSAEDVQKQNFEYVNPHAAFGMMLSPLEFQGKLLGRYGAMFREVF